jgi:hypothetical protein
LSYIRRKGYSVFLTEDANLPYQQNLQVHGIAVVWVGGPGNTFERIRSRLQEVIYTLPEAVVDSSTVRVEEDETVIEGLGLVDLLTHWCP